MNAEKQALRSNPLTWKKIGLILLVLAIAGYQYYQQDGVLDGGAVVESAGNAESDKAASSENRKSARPFFQEGPRGLKISPAGLEYTDTGHGEHRTDHVLRHARDMPDRQGSHGVFLADSDQQVFALIDEAYQLVKQGSQQVREEPSRGDGRQAYVVDMKRKIGYKGGQSGKRSGNPPLSRIKLVLADNQVITAFPY